MPIEIKGSRIGMAVSFTNTNDTSTPTLTQTSVR
jgi:hypothetical protein